MASVLCYILHIPPPKVHAVHPRLRLVGSYALCNSFPPCITAQNNVPKALGVMWVGGSVGQGWPVQSTDAPKTLVYGHANCWNHTLGDVRW